jgi:hypothetical protein
MQAKRQTGVSALDLHWISLLSAGAQAFYEAV